MDFGSGQLLKNMDFFKHHFLRVFEKIEPDKGGHFQNINILRVFEKWDPDIFQKSEISKISSSSHSKNAHIKLNGFQWVFGGWGDAPFIFFMGQMGQKSKNGPPSCLSTWVGQ